MTDKTVTPELEAALDRLLVERTFSLQSVSAIEKLRESRKALENDVCTLERRVKELEAQRDRLQASCSEAGTACRAWEAREDDLVKREKLIVEREQRAIAATAAGDAYRDAFQIVFHNTVVRETTNRTVPVSYPGGNVMMTPTTDHVEKTTG